MNANITSQKITFWNFLKKNSIEIPIIQRDYAQGRLGKESLRKNFLTDIKNALASGTEMKLDFIYGSFENGKLNPLDGQQRLTTLWLLHWYISLCAGKLGNACHILRNFTYETRISSREFCESLCKPENFADYTPKDLDIVSFITSRTWFYSAWKQDPTIQSMLRMLGGTDVSNKKGEDIVDGLEELFQTTDKLEFDDYWTELTEKETIVFYHLPLNDFGLSDDLYIKMNARGKQLTSFENFKADLEGYIRKQEGNKEWEKMLDAESGIPIKMDTIWTDIFWRNNKENKIDGIYFAFLNRFFFNELICQNFEKQEDDSLKALPTYKYLYGEKGDDSTIEYDGFEKYQQCVNEKTLKSMMYTLDNYSKLNKDIDINSYFPDWVKKETKFQFIPKYENNTITTLTQNERIIFLAIARYFEKREFDVVSFKQWMRVVWNIVENNDAEMIGVMLLINELAEYSDDIYGFLVSKNLKIKSNAAKEQVNEEIVKAKKIVSDQEKWEEIIIKAENEAFFNGAIRFLFNNEKSEPDWNEFDIKWNNAKLYFDENGTKSGYRKDAILLRYFLCLSSEPKDKDFWFGNGDNFWRDVLLDTQYAKSVAELLKSESFKIDKSADIWIKDKKLLANIFNDKNHLWHILFGWRDYNVLTSYDKKISGNINSPRDVVVIDHPRNELLYNTDVAIDNGHIIKNTKFLYGWDIYFEYNNNYFLWYGNPNETDLDIYLMEKKKNYYYFIERTNPTKNKHTDADNYFCFKVTDEMYEDDKRFLKALDKLIREKKKDEKH